MKHLRTVSKQNKSWQTCHSVHFILWEHLPFEWSHTLTLLYSVVTVQPFFLFVQQRNEKYCCPCMQLDADVTKIAFDGCPEQPQLPRQALVQQHSDFIITCVSCAPTKAFCCICSQAAHVTRPLDYPVRAQAHLLVCFCHPHKLQNLHCQCCTVTFLNYILTLHSYITLLQGRLWYILASRAYREALLHSWFTCLQGCLHQTHAGLLLGCLEVVIEDVVAEATGTNIPFCCLLLPTGLAHCSLGACPLLP